MDGPLSACLGPLDARIEREIRRLRTRYELSLDEFRGLYVSDEHVDRLIADGRKAAVPEIEEDPPRPAAHLGARLPRWAALQREFDLTPLDEDLLLIALAPEIDPKYETLFAYLNDDITRKWATADLARRILDDVANAPSVLAALSGAGRLPLRRVIERLSPPSGKPALFNSGFVVHPCVTYWVHGQSAALALPAPGVSWTPSAEARADDAGARNRAVVIARLVARVRSGHALPIIALVGAPGSGRGATAIAAAALTGRSLVWVDLAALIDADGDGADALERMAPVLALEPAVVVLQGFGGAHDDDARQARTKARVERAIARWPAGTLVMIRADADERWRECAGHRRTIEMRCGEEAHESRSERWRRETAAAGIELSDAEVLGLAGRFTLTPGQLRAAVATAQDLAAMHGDAAETHLAGAARLTSDQSLGRLASKVVCGHGWDDLVLPAATVRRLRELAAAIRQRHVVYGAWGFGARVAAGAGIKALFAGASGTGKTMAAGVLARDLELDLYKIDLSGVVSKYIGETEKNLDRIFRAARAANAIVFLDEAEAIMGKRSDVKDAHDRYANIEVAYLLQKLEEHEGIVILATNLRRNIDDAFNRRMQYVIDFPRPAEPERERIWRGMFPAGAPVDPDVDFAFLAKEFDLSGGDIRNVALDAAFLAAQDGGVIAMRAVVEALSRQMVKEGKTPTGTDFRQYQRLLAARR